MDHLDEAAKKGQVDHGRDGGEAAGRGDGVFVGGELAGVADDVFVPGRFVIDDHGAAIEAAGGTIVQERIAAEAKAAARVEKRNAAKGKAPPAKAPKGDANKVSARARRTAAKA